MESMKSRVLTAAIGIPLAVVLLVLGEFFHPIMYIIVSLLNLIMVYELLLAKKLHTNAGVFIPCAVYAVVQPLLIPFKFSYITLYAFIVVMFLMMIKDFKKVTYGDLCYSAFGTMVIVYGLSSLLLLPPMYDNYFTFFFVLCIGICWFADAGAYFTGVYFGKHKLCPQISPNKTVEGFLGGIAAGTVSSFLIGFVYTFIYNNAKFDFLLLFVVGLAASLISVLGDLSFSVIKRSCKIKDFGSIFPGHGGFLDRFDSVILAAPMIYFIGKYFSIFSI